MHKTEYSKEAWNMRIFIIFNEQPFLKPIRNYSINVLNFPNQN